MQQQDILDRYRHLRGIGTRHHHAALDHLARPAIMERAKHLGLSHGGTILAESEEEMTLVFDLAVHTARRGRSRAIDRYAKAAAPWVGSDETHALKAICDARFSIWRIVRRHEVAGLIVHDSMRDREAWLVDEALTASAAPELTFASRLYWPDDFAMTCGVLVPINAELIEEALLEGWSWLRNRDLEELADDPRFAMAIYRTAVMRGTMDSVGFRASGGSV